MILVYVVCKPNSKSLRETIVNDSKLEDSQFTVAKNRTVGRNPGWAQLKSTVGYHGGIKLEWDNDAKVLLCRIVTRGDGDPSGIIGDFVAYILRRFRRRVVAINTIVR